MNKEPLRFPDDYGSPPTEPVRGAYQVWLARDGGGYDYVSDVGADEARGAMEEYNQWAGHLFPPTRQAGKGDIVVTPSGASYRCEGETFRETFDPGKYAHHQHGRGKERER